MISGWAGGLSQDAEGFDLPFEQKCIEYPALDKSTPIPFYSLPGQGTPQEGCGEPVPYHCNSCGQAFWHESSCLNRTCPNCYQKWASAEGRLASGRIEMGRALTRQGRGRGRILHTVVSMPVCHLKEGRERARKVLKKHGLEGGCLIQHPFRQNDDGSFVLDGYLHFHAFVLAFGNVEPGGLPSDGDVVFKVIRDARHGDYRGFRRSRELRQAIRYTLTHAGIVEGRHALTWFGTLSYNMIPNKALAEACPEGWEEMTRKVEPQCPACGSRDTEPCFQLDLCGYGFGSSRALAPVPNQVHEPPES